MKKLLVLILLLVVAGVAILQPEKKEEKPAAENTVVFERYKSNQICEIQRRVIEDIELRPYSVENASNLRFWKVTITGDEKVNFVTDQEDPFVKGQLFILGSNCRDLTLEEHKENSSLLAESCFKIYRLDTLKKQIKAECGYIKDDKIIFLKKN